MTEAPDDSVTVRLRSDKLHLTDGGHFSEILQQVFLGGLRGVWRKSVEAMTDKRFLS